MGCTCGMLQNQFGLGDDMTGKTRHWIVAHDCVLHNELAERLNVYHTDRIRKEISEREQDITEPSLLNSTSETA